MTKLTKKEMALTLTKAKLFSFLFPLAFYKAHIYNSKKKKNSICFHPSCDSDRSISFPFFSPWLYGCIRDSQCLQRALGDSQQACLLAAFHNSGAVGNPLKCRLPSGRSQSVPRVGRRTLRACKAGVTWMEGGRPKQDPVSETEENEVHWEAGTNLCLGHRAIPGNSSVL